MQPAYTLCVPRNISKMRTVYGEVMYFIDLTVRTATTCTTDNNWVRIIAGVKKVERIRIKELRLA